MCDCCLKLCPCRGYNESFSTGATWDGYIYWARKNTKLCWIQLTLTKVPIRITFLNQVKIFYNEEEEDVDAKKYVYLKV